MDQHVTSHSLTMGPLTTAAWSTMEMIGAGLTLAGQFAPAPATYDGATGQLEQNSIIKCQIKQILECQTTRGETCNFPFSYQGVTYNSCMEYYGYDWCRTDSGWGICSNNCQDGK